MQFLWAMINALQLIIRVPLFTIEMPYNAQMFFKTLVSIASFDLLPVDFLNEFFFHFTETDPVSESFDEMGYETKSTIKNIGSLFYYLMFYIFLLLILFFIKILQVFFPK